MPNGGRDKLLNSVLWGAVAACGQFTMLFLSVVGRIRVSFVSNAPSFAVDPRGAVALTKDTVLQLVWVLTILFSVMVFWVTYRRPRPTRRAWVVWGTLGFVLTIAGGLVDPWWAGILLVDGLIIAGVLRTALPG